MSDALLDRLVVAVGTQYLVDAEIGRGGMAVVYRATDLRLHRRVAIKVLPPELAFNADVRERFLREAQTSAQLSHPRIVPIYTVDEREGIVYFVMALVDGESLADRLARVPRMPIPEVRRILMDVCDALSYAHANGVVHRDVKPDNVMLDRATGDAVVTDFGIARAAAADSRLTVTGVAIGTPAYMSPEQALGERELDGRSDLYSLGIIAYQMLAGEVPFKASNTPAMLMKHLSETPRPLQAIRPDVPPTLANAIARALAKKPEERWPNVAAFKDALSGAREAAPFVDRMEPQVASAWNAVAAPAPVRASSPFDQVALAAPLAPAMPPMPAMPTWGSRREWKEWRRQHREWERAVRTHAKRFSGEYDAALPVEDRIARFRRHAMGTMGTAASLAAVNAVTSPHVWWSLIPVAFMTLGIASRAGKLWADGVPIARLFARGTLAGTRQRSIASASPEALALELAPVDVLGGPHGAIVRAAASDKAAVHETLARLAPAERDMIPDVGPTVDALAGRVGSLALTLHRLDADLGGASLHAIRARLAALRAEAGAEPSTEQERRLALLERQRGTIEELEGKRGTLATQMESASLALRNLRFDLLKLRSSGLGGAMGDLTSATQEARALSREIGHAVDAAREVRDL